MDGARAYFKEPLTVRNHVHKIAFHEGEATTTAFQLGRRISASDAPLEYRRQLLDWIVRLRSMASEASDVGDRLVIYAVKRSL